MLCNRVPGVHLSIAEHPTELKQKKRTKLLFLAEPNRTEIDAAILELNQKNI